MAGLGTQKFTYVSMKYIKHALFFINFHLHVNVKGQFMLINIWSSRAQGVNFSL